MVAEAGTPEMATGVVAKAAAPAAAAVFEECWRQLYVAVGFL